MGKARTMASLFDRRPARRSRQSRRRQYVVENRKNIVISKAGGLTPPIGMNKARGFIAELITVAGKNRDKVRRVRRKVYFTRFADR